MVTYYPNTISTYHRNIIAYPVMVLQPHLSSTAIGPSLSSHIIPCYPILSFQYLIIQDNGPSTIVSCVFFHPNMHSFQSHQSHVPWFCVFGGELHACLAVRLRWGRSSRSGGAQELCAPADGRIWLG